MKTNELIKHCSNAEKGIEMGNELLSFLGTVVSAFKKLVTKMSLIASDFEENS